MSYDRYLDSQELKEEREMESGEVSEAEFNAKVDNYIQALLTEFITYGQGNRMSRFAYEVWQDWFDTQGPNMIDIIRLNLAIHEDEIVGHALVASLREFLREIASKAVRDKEG